MSRSGLQAVSRRISAEKAVKYVGSAEVSLQNLEFPNSKSLNEENVKRLATLFRNQGNYSPGDTSNRIPAVIDAADLQTALTASGLTQDSLLCGSSKRPRLVFEKGFRLECLRGGDRVKASKKVSRSPNPHWVIDLFTADITDEAKRDLSEEYASEKKLGDGVYYRKIREYQGIWGKENPYLEHKWWGRLGASSKSENKKERLEQLWKHPKFGPAFDAFRHLQALFCDLRLSAINKLISMGCCEEHLSSLKDIRDFFYRLFDQDESAMERLDEDTVLAIQLKAPGASEQDKSELDALIRSGRIFRAFDETARNRIWLNLCSLTVDCLVPSFYAFFENIKYWQAPADCMRRLIPREGKQSIRRSFENAFSIEESDESDCIIQTSWSSFRSIPMPRADSFDVAYRQLWLYALREQQSMPIPRKQKLAIAETRQADETVVFRFACLAQKLGFVSDNITALVQRNPDQAIARKSLTTARNEDEFEYPNISANIKSVMQIFSEARLIPSPLAPMEDDIDDIGEPPARCGTPHLADHTRDKPNMFLDKIHTPMNMCSSNLTSFFIQRSIYIAFFGQDIGISFADLHATHGEHTFDYIRQQNLAPPEAETREQAPPHNRAEEREARMSDLALKEAALRNDIIVLNERVLALKNEEKDALARLDSLKHAEVEKTRGLETLQADAQDYQSEIADLERMRATSGEEIRLDLLATGENTQADIASQEKDKPESEHDASLLQEGAFQVQQPVGEENRPPLEHTVREESHLDNEVSNTSVETERTGDQPSAEHRADGLEVTRYQDAEEVSREMVSIAFKLLVFGELKTLQEVQVSPAEPSEVRRVAAKYTRQGLGLFSSKGDVLRPQNCFRRAMDDESRTIHLQSEYEAMRERKLPDQRLPKRAARRERIMDKDWLQKQAATRERVMDKDRLEKRAATRQRKKDKDRLQAAIRETEMDKDRLRKRAAIRETEMDDDLPRKKDKYRPQAATRETEINDDRRPEPLRERSESL